MYIAGTSNYLFYSEEIVTSSGTLWLPMLLPYPNINGAANYLELLYSFLIRADPTTIFIDNHLIFFSEFGVTRPNNSRNR